MNTSTLRNSVCRVAISLTVGVALLLVQNVRTVSAVSRQNPNPPPFLPRDFASQETAALDSFGKSLKDFSDKLKAVDGSARPSSQQIDELESKANSLKGKVSAFKNSMERYIQKVKDAGKFTPELDSFIEAELSKSGKTELVQAIRSSGGARAALQKSASESNKVTEGVDEAMREIKGRGATVRKVAMSSSLIANAPPLKRSPLCKVYWAALVAAAGLTVALFLVTGPLGVVVFSGWYVSFALYVDFYRLNCKY